MGARELGRDNLQANLFSETVAVNISPLFEVSQDPDPSTKAQQAHNLQQTALPRDVSSAAALAQLGALITTYTLARGITWKALGERVNLRPLILQGIVAGEDAKAPWSVYERIFNALKIPHEHRTHARELWILSRDSKKASDRVRPVFTRPDTLYRLRADIAGHDLEPDPLRASTKEEFLEVMREFHVWAGELSYREISLNSRKSVGASTLCEALDPNKRPRLPTLKLVQAFIQGCGGDEDTVARWTTAWRQVRMGRCAAAVSPLRPVQQQDAS
ncbi:hypothetical protein ACBR40_45570 [Nonomuraea sp. AD125B]|uniref:hypothetical protein n=1 Tax=Nonomuraea sp. AD125B TaxID=3242897 RepID=UPI003528703D